jgi:hypothetical protein
MKFIKLFNKAEPDVNPIQGITPKTHLGKSAPDWARAERQSAIDMQALRESESRANAQRNHELALAERTGVAHAREAARLLDNKEYRNRINGYGVSILKAPLSLAVLPFKMASSLASKALSVAKYSIGGVAIAGAVSGTIDHLDKPNPDNDPTLVRIFELSKKNLVDFNTEYALSCKAGIIIDSAAKALMQGMETVSDINEGPVPQNLSPSEEALDNLPAPMQDSRNYPLPRSADISSQKQGLSAMFTACESTGISQEGDINPAPQPLEPETDLEFSPSLQHG